MRKQRILLSSHHFHRVNKFNIKEREKEIRKKRKKEEERKQNHGNVEETRDQKEYLRDAYLNGTSRQGDRESTPTANTNFCRRRNTRLFRDT